MTYPPDQLVIRRFHNHEVDKAIADAIQRGYVLIDRGNFRNDYIKNSKITYWAKLRRKPSADSNVFPLWED